MKTKIKKQIFHKTISKFLVFVFVIVLNYNLTISQNVLAANFIDPTLSYQGRLTDSGGTPVGDGSKDFCFSIWSAATNGSKLWPSGTPTVTAATTTNGVFNAIVGVADDLSSFDFTANSTVYLQVEARILAGGACLNPTNFEPLTPRQRISASSFARSSLKVIGGTFTTALTVNGGTLTLTANAANTSVLTVGAGAVSVSGSNTGDQTLAGLGGAATSLNNLASVAVNAVLIPGTAGGLDFGSTAKPWADIYLAGTSGTPGTNQFKITGASTSGLRTITLPDASGTLLLSGGALGTPSSGVATNLTGTAAGLTAGTATTANALAASATVTSPVITTGLTASGSAANTFVGSSGTFITSTGANTLNGAVDINAATTPSLTLNSGKTNTGFVLINGKTSGGLKFLPVDAAGQTVTVSLAAQTTGAATLTIPDMAGVSKTIAWLESPVFTTPNLGTPSAVVLTNASGTASSLTAGTATNATNTAITDDTTTNATMYPTWATTASGNQAQKVSSTKLTFNPSTGALTTTTFVGALTGTASGNLVTGGALGTPSSGTLTNATGLPIAGLTSSTTTALGVGSIELGHSTDTTLSRSSAGVLAVEGVVVPLNSITNIHTAQQVELGHATDTTLARVSAGVVSIEGVNILLNGGALGTPSSGTMTNVSGTAASLTAGKATNMVGGNSTTLLGSIPYQSNTDTTTMLAPNTTAGIKYLAMTGTGTNGAAPAWTTIAGGGDMVLAANETITGIKTFGTIGGAVDKLVLAGSTSGSSILNAAAVAGTTTLTLPGTTGTLMLNPMTAVGDLTIGGATNGSETRLAMGSALQVLRVNAGATALEWAAASGGGAPGGNTTKVQYNNAGAFGGAANVGITGTGDLNLTAVTQGTTPATPSAGTVTLFGRNAGGRVMAAIVGPSGQDTLLQPHLGRNKIALWNAAGNSTTITAFGAAALTATGTATAVNVATTNVRTRIRQLEYLVTVAATTAVAGFRSTVAQYFFGNATNSGGFHYIVQWGPATGVATTTNRAFVGLSNLTAAPTDVEPSTLTTMAGMGWNAADTNVQFMSNDASGAATKVDLGASFPVPTVDRTDMYELIMFAAPNSTTLYWQVINIVNGAVQYGTVTASADLPAVNTLLAPRGYMSVGGTSSVIGLGLAQLYIETDY